MIGKALISKDMGIRGIDNAAQMLCNAIKRQNKYVEFESRGEIEQIFTEAYRIEPRIIGWVMSWEGTRRTVGVHRRLYSLTIQYAERIVDNIEEVVLDNGEWTLSEAVHSYASIPPLVYVVTNDPDMFCKRIKSDIAEQKEKGINLPEIQIIVNREVINGYYSIVLLISAHSQSDLKRPVQEVTKELCENTEILLNKVTGMKMRADVMLSELKVSLGEVKSVDNKDKINTENNAKPYEGGEAFIFVSYAHRNRDDVMPIICALQGLGYRVWYDEGIDPGTEWDENIATHIMNCKCVIAFLSPEYVESDNCCDELNYARDLKKSFADLPQRSRITSWNGNEA